MPAHIDLLETDAQSVLSDWLKRLSRVDSGFADMMDSEELASRAETFVHLLKTALASGRSDTFTESQWQPVLQFLEQLSSSMALQGVSAEQTATFVFSLKKSMFASLYKLAASDPERFAEKTWQVNELIDRLGMHTFNFYLKGREQVIRRQQEELLELSTPVVKLWDGVLALPMIGTLDSARTQVVMESLLERIVETGSVLAIIDITGVPTVDTLVAQHLLKTITAIRLMGAECIISGVRPQIAQTIVHLGVDLHGVMTKANLSDALSLAFKRIGLTVTKIAH